MTRGREDIVEKTLRHMTENLNGAYNAMHPEGHPNAGDHCTNSGTCILVCCYINALGKILSRGGPPEGTRRRDFIRFREFLKRCMNDFLVESNMRRFPRTPRGRTSGVEWLHEVYRYGFVHAFRPSSPHVKWGRFRRKGKPVSRYWFERKGRIVLNIDGLVGGFFRGMDKFRLLVAADNDLRTHFKDYILAE